LWKIIIILQTHAHFYHTESWKEDSAFYHVMNLLHALPSIDICSVSSWFSCRMNRVEVNLVMIVCIGLSVSWIDFQVLSVAAAIL